MSAKTKIYEGMFLLETGNNDFNSASEPVRTALERSGAEIMSLKPWDDRRLAYEIMGKKRALYALAYFKVDPLKVAEIEHDCKLDERVIRALILRRDNFKPDEINAPTPLEIGAKPAEYDRESAPREAERPAEVIEVPVDIMSEAEAEKSE